MKKFIKVVLKDMSVIGTDKVIDLISMLPEEQHENALTILLGATDEIFLGEVKCESGKQPTDTNYTTVDFNHLTQFYTVEYLERTEVHISHNLTDEEVVAMKAAALEMPEFQVKETYETGGKKYNWVKTNSWIRKTKQISKVDWEKHYKEII